MLDCLGRCGHTGGQVQGHALEGCRLNVEMGDTGV